MQRSVYHKYAEVEIEVDEKKLKEYTDVGASITDYLFDNENLFSEKIDEKISKAKYGFGMGMHTSDGWTNAEEESEWRYEVVGKKLGGHL